MNITTMNQLLAILRQQQDNLLQSDNEVVKYAMRHRQYTDPAAVLNQQLMDELFDHRSGEVTCTWWLVEALDGQFVGIKQYEAQFNPIRQIFAEPIITDVKLPDEGETNVDETAN